MDESTIARFNRFVDRSGGPDACWPWTGCKNAKGYGWFGALIDSVRRTWKAHRVAFLIAHGRWPEPLCCHFCDNPPCCNPAHLYEGGATDNQHDRLLKRFPHWETLREQILARPRQKSPATARRLGIRPNMVRRVRKGTPFALDY